MAMRASPLWLSGTTAREMVDRLADPLLSGVYGGKPPRAQRARGAATFC